MDAKTRETYGARVTGCSGEEIFWCNRRRLADKIRKTIRIYKQMGGWTGWWTLDRLVHTVALPQNFGRRAEDIAREFLSHKYEEVI